MKRLIFVGVTLALVLGLVWVPSVAAVEADIIIHKTIDEGCPEETFRFEAWRDLNSNGVIDAGDTLQGMVDITGEGTGVITVGIFGLYIIHEALIPGSAYQAHPDQSVFVTCDEHVYFHNVCEPPEFCELVILKTDTAGNPLGGACFTITPDPWTGTDSVTVCDNDSNDECPEDGVFCLADLICELEVTVEETTVPDGYVGADSQIVVIGETLELTFVNAKPGPDICIEKLVDCNDDEVYLPRDTGYYGDTPSWHIRVWNCGDSPLLNVMVSDTNGMSWGPFDLDIGQEWQVTYGGAPIFEDTTNTAEAIAEDELGAVVGPVCASATNVVENGNDGGYSCSCCYECDHLTVDWEGTITSEPLYCSNDKLAVDCFAPSFDLSHNLFLEKGTHAPVVLTTTHYVIVVREIKETPATPENMEAIVVFNITPADAEFNKDIFLTLGVPEIPADAINVTMAYYDDVNGIWELMESEAGGPSGVAELTLSAAINHFSIYGVLAELEPTPPPQPARFTASGLNIEPSVEKSVFMTRTGESVTITANVANKGGQEGTYTVELKLNGETVDTEIVTLAAGQSRPVTFTVPELEPGQYDVEVAGLTDTFTASRTITWWLILIIIVAVGLIIWGVVWGTRRRRKTQLEG